MPSLSKGQLGAAHFVVGTVVPSLSKGQLAAARLILVQTVLKAVNAGHRIVKTFSFSE